MTTYNVRLSIPGQTLFQGSTNVDDSTSQIIIANYQDVPFNVLDTKNGYENTYNYNTQTFKNFAMDLTSITVDPIVIQGYSYLGPLVAQKILVNGDPNNNTVKITYLVQNDGSSQTFNNSNVTMQVSDLNTSSPLVSTSFNKTIVYEILFPLALYQVGSYFLRKMK